MDKLEIFQLVLLVTLLVALVIGLLIYVAVEPYGWLRWVNGLLAAGVFIVRWWGRNER